MGAPQPSFKLNPAFQKQWRDAIRELAAITKKESPEGLHKLVLLSARRFVKNVADVTPPASGSANAKAKVVGEQACLSDLLKLALPVTVQGATRAQTREVLATAEDLLAAHHRSRVNANGRVNPRNRREKLFMSQADFNKVLRLLQSKVGWLAAGMNAAAAKLGVSLPAWIKRHGNRYGKIELLENTHSIKARIIQDVPFADNVKDYGRRWNFALEKEVKALVNQVKAIHAKAEGKARRLLK